MESKKEMKTSKSSRREKVKGALRKIVRLVRLRFIAGKSTGEIMGLLKSEEDRKTMVAVACLDLKDKDFEALVAAESPSVRSELIALRQRASLILRSVSC